MGWKIVEINHFRDGQNVAYAVEKIFPLDYEESSI
jgi:hypothetical protein